ncbi:uncharacterized protein LOC141614736 [Silene latifolia]|uniref:uncharacterized protein LOC141614736 n=1 Tax=Silene latifolia TaxID=37657 RepID=UPI003D76EBF3
MKKFNHETYLLWKNHHQEEVAFVDEVAARGTNIEGGCGSIWPPRSYECSFCKREFKSAQALGGHMNVHRRDRALLKQSMLAKKSFASHISTTNKSSKYSQSSHNYHGSAKKVDQHVRDGNFRGERDDGYLSYKRSKKNGEYVALLPSFLGETIKRSKARNDGLQVPGILAFKASNSIDDLDLELRLGNSPQNV